MSPTSSFFPSSFICENDAGWSGLSLGSTGISCPHCVPAIPWAVLATPLGGRQAGKASALCQPCSVTQTHLGCQGCVQHKSKPQPIPATRKKITLPQPKAAQLVRNLYASKHPSSSYQPAVITTGTPANNFHELSIQYRLFAINKWLLTYLLQMKLLDMTWGNTAERHYNIWK